MWRYLRRIIFRKYILDLDAFFEKKLKAQIEEYKSSVDIRDLVRERFKGINPRRPDETPMLQAHIEKLEDVERLAFLAKAKDVLNNETFKVVVDSVILDQEHLSITEAKDIIEVDFGRATINGAMIIEEALDHLSVMYREEVDRNSKMTETERLSAI